MYAVTLPLYHPCPAWFVALSSSIRAVRLAHIWEFSTSREISHSVYTHITPAVPWLAKVRQNRRGSI